MLLRQNFDKRKCETKMIDVNKILKKTHVKIRCFSMAYCKVLQWIYQKHPPEVLYKIAFSTEYPQMTASEFLQKDIDKFKECQTNESTKKIRLRAKNQSME